MSEILQSLFGLIVFVAIAWSISEDRHAVVWRTVVTGIALQIVLAVLLLKLPVSRVVFQWLGAAVGVLQEATQAGTSFVFGYLGGGKLPFKVETPASAFILAFHALPLILVVSRFDCVVLLLAHPSRASRGVLTCARAHDENWRCERHCRGGECLHRHD